MMIELESRFGKTIPLDDFFMSPPLKTLRTPSGRRDVWNPHFRAEQAVVNTDP